MKRILSFLFIVAALQMQAQDIDRTQAPKPGPAPVINIPDAAEFILPNGLKVFVVRNTKLPMVSATLTIDRDAVLEGKKAGMADMAGALLRYGTTKMKKEQLDEAIDFLGGSVNTSALSASASSLTGNFPKIFSLMSDVVLRPSFSPAQLEKIRKQTLSGIESEKDDPDAISKNVSSVLLYGKNHPYGEIQTEQSVKSVTLADIKKFYSTNWKPNIAYLVFVGDITPEEAKKLAVQNFGAWPKGVVPKEVYPVVKAPAKTYIAIVDRPSSVQSVINITSPVQLKPGAPDAIPASLMNTILGGGFSSRLMQNLREKYGFTYGSRSSLSPNRLVGSFAASASVRNEKTDSAIGQFLYELKRINTAAPADTEITSLKNYMSGGFARSLESPATIANFALNIARYHLPKDYYRNYLTRLSAVSPAEVQQMAKKYITTDRMVITIVGNAKEIAPGLEKYGEVHYFDMYGNAVAKPVVKATDLKAEDILKKAIAAYGGETAIAAVKDIQLNGSVNLMGQTLEYTQKNVFPSGFSTTVSMAGNAIMKQSKKDSVYDVQMPGGASGGEVDDAAKEEIDARAAFFAERYMLANPGYAYTVRGIEKVEGKDAYIISIKSPKGITSTAFYDVASGLKVQEMRESPSPMGGQMNITTLFTEYKTFEGIKVPTKLTIDLGQFKQDIIIETVKVNQGLQLSDL